MKLAKYLKQLSVLSLSTVLASPAALAHPGHETSTFLHGVLHTEHMLVVLAVGVVLAISSVIKDQDS